MHACTLQQQPVRHGGDAALSGSHKHNKNQILQCFYQAVCMRACVRVHASDCVKLF